MASRRIRGGGSGRGSTAAVLVVVTVPLLLSVQLGPGAERLTAHSGLNTYLIGLGTALVLYVHWRLSGGMPIGWLVAGVTAVSVQGAVLKAMLIGDPAGVAEAGAWVALAHLVLGLVLLMVVPLARRVALRVDPLTLGLAVGASAALLRWVMVDLVPPLLLPAPAVQVLHLAVLAAGLALAWTTCRLAGVPDWVRWRLGVAVGLLAVGHAALEIVGRDPAYVLAVLCDVSAGMLLATTSVALLRLSIRQGHEAVTQLQLRLDQVESDNRTDRARLHEIGATVAGIASASRIIHAPGLPDGRRTALEQMLLSETGRLERLLADRAPQVVTSVDLDEAIRPLVVRQQARGVRVSWCPTGLRARGRRDDVTEVVGVLLENAARHACGSGVSVDVRMEDDGIEILVSDHGPGVAPAVRRTLFDWGVRGPDSEGQGIGLHIARQLMVKQEGYLRLVAVPGGGATFVVGLPAVRTSRRAVPELAR